MLIEQLIFIITAFTLFVYMFYQLIKKNDTKYVPILAIQALRNSNRFYNIIFFKRRYRDNNKSYYLYIINYISYVNYSFRKVKYKHNRNFK